MTFSCGGMWTSTMRAGLEGGWMRERGLSHGFAFRRIAAPAPTTSELARDRRAQFGERSG